MKRNPTRRSTHRCPPARRALRRCRRSRLCSGQRPHLYSRPPRPSHHLWTSPHRLYSRAELHPDSPHPVRWRGYPTRGRQNPNIERTKQPPRAIGCHRAPASRARSSSFATSPNESRHLKNLHAHWHALAGLPDTSTTAPMRVSDGPLPPATSKSTSLSSAEAPDLIREARISSTNGSCIGRRARIAAMRTIGSGSSKYRYTVPTAGEYPEFSIARNAVILFVALWAFQSF